MPSSTQRLQVWRGERLKTSGGLSRKDLIKNKRGKIVSKKKSSQARDKNNLGDFLLKLGKKVKKDEMLHPAGKASKERELKKTAASVKKAPAKLKTVPAKPRAVVAKPRAVAAKPKVAPPPKPVAALPKPAAKKKKKALPEGYNPITRQPYDKKSGHGFVSGGGVNIDNIKSMQPRSGRRSKRGESTEAFAEALRRKRGSLW